MTWKNQKKDEARSAYYFYVHDVKSDFIKSHPGMTFSEIGRALGKCWNDMTKEQKKKYIILEQNDKKKR